MSYPYQVQVWQRIGGAWTARKLLKARTANEATGQAIKQAKRIGTTGFFGAAIVCQQEENGEWKPLPGVQIGRPGGSVFTITPALGDWKAWLDANLGLKDGG